MTRCRTAACLLLALSVSAAAPRAASATEIDAPAPLTEDIGRPDARTYLARWLGGSAPRSDGEFVTTVTTAAPGSRAGSGMIVGSEGLPALRLPVPEAQRLPPLALLTADRSRTDESAAVIISSDGPSGAWARPRSRVLGTTEGAPGGLRFDVRPADRNPIALGGDALDEVTARVVRTPEPGTIALFALGLLGLGFVVVGVRRQRNRSS